MPKKKNIVLTDERRQLLDEFVKTYRRPLDYYAYKYSSEKLTKEDIYSMLLETLTVYYSDENNKPIEKYGVTSYLNTMCRSIYDKEKKKVKTNIYKTKLVTFVDNKIDESDNSKNLISPIDENSVSVYESMDIEKQVKDIFVLMQKLNIKQKHIDIFKDLYLMELTPMELAKKYNMTSTNIRIIRDNILEKIRNYYGVVVKKENFVKRVICLETNEIFLNVVDASEKTGINHWYIRKSCKLKTNDSETLNFRFLD